MTIDEVYLFSEFEDDYLAHEGRSKLDGAPIGSGRYPLGSGEYPFQHDASFEAERNRLAKEHSDWDNTKIAKAMNMSTAEFRARVTMNKLAKEAHTQARIAERLAKGYTTSAIARELNMPEPTVRYYIKKKENALGRKTAMTTALKLKELVDSKGMLDIGAGAEIELGVSKEMLRAATAVLSADGYSVINNLQVPQATNPGKYTNLKVLAPPGTTKKYAFNNMEDIQSVADYDVYKQHAIEQHPDFERTKYGMYYPQSISSDRVWIKSPKYGGTEEDGMIYLRRGVEDISLGKSNYAQVRIAVDDKMYLKGIAMYSDDIPEGYDVVYCSSKPDSWTKEEVFKAFKTKEVDGQKVVDRDNVFGAAIKPEEKGGQRFYIGEDGKEHLSAINIVNSEGDWMNWKKRLSSQFLSKQNIPLIKQQLDITYENKLAEFEDIMAITNPIVKEKYLQSFADDCDASAVHLKAAALPGQTSRLLLPIPELKEGECYCPGYRTGDTVVLIRHPHGGTFEIPVLRVNNEHPIAKSRLGDAPDAIGINHAAAEQLSGADFDGDTALVIPISRGGVGTKIKADKMLEGLKGWTTDEYAITDKSSPLYSVDAAHGFRKQDQMGKVSNLITDMTIIGAKEDQLVRAVKYSMVVIDAEKHHLDWRKAFDDCNIQELYIKYQGKKQGAAATLISRASSTKNIPARRPAYTEYEKDKNGNFVLDEFGEKIRKSNSLIKSGINVETGEKAWKETGEISHKPIYVYKTDADGKPLKDSKGRKIKETYSDIDEKTGKEIQRPVIVGYKDSPKKTEIKKMTDALENQGDAHAIVSTYEAPQELLYANYANQVYALANRARKELVSIEMPKRNKEAAEEYADEVESLKRKLEDALKNSPRERQAQLAAAYIYKCKKLDNPNMSAEDAKKINSQALAEARVRFGAKKDRVEITDREWEAIQAGAISNEMLRSIMSNTDTDALRAKAMPKDYKNTISPSKERWIRKWQSKGGYNSETIADMLGLSVDAVKRFNLEYKGKLTTSEQAIARSWRASGKSYAEIAEELGVAPGTVENFLEGVG